ncbi:hypothetical protein D9Q98_006334 [Chlorella vulgaris]|uniref:Uncharacterized protein n=1 Tax=Chlorella vulgaris TaxID=3077 RepID=A0A9D4TK10_CHLVU|nr:hypothetical protein D9Q98_006334 [Chlorella vulgaris]
MKLFGSKSDKTDDKDTPRGIFGRLKKKEKTPEPECSRLSPGLSDYSVDTAAMSALHREQGGEHAPPPAADKTVLEKAPSDAASSNLCRLASLTLADSDTGASLPPCEAPAVENEAAAAAAVEQISELAVDLTAAASVAKAHRAGCLALAAFAEEVAGVLAARAPVSAPSGQLEKVAVLLGECITLVGSCAGPAWILAAASPERGVCEAMTGLHSDMLAILKDQGLDFVPGGLRLSGAEYRDSSKPLQRRLKQLGAGSLAAGLEVVARSEGERNELAAQLGCEPAEVKRSALHVVTAGLVGCDSAAAARDAETVAEHRQALEHLFASYASFGVTRDLGSAPELDSFRCAKLVREAGLLGGRLRMQDLDVLFAAAARKGGSSRRLPFAGFLKLLALVAEKKVVPLGEVVGAVAALQGPSTQHATTPDQVKLHDDKSTYTGVYARGMSVADDKPDLGKLVDRDAAEKATRRTSASAGRRASGASTPTASSAAGTPPLSRTVSSAVGGSEAAPKSEGKQVAANIVAISVSAAAASPRVSACASHEGQEEAAATPPVNLRTNRLLQDMFNQFAAFGRSSATAAGGELSMDCQQMMKLCRDCGLLNKTLSGTRVDLVFRSTVPQGARRISYRQFCSAVPRLADARGCDAAELARLIVASGGPCRNNTTTPEAVRLSNKSNFSGIAARGGPSTVEKERITLAGMCDRSGR